MYQWLKKGNFCSKRQSENEDLSGDKNKKKSKLELKTPIIAEKAEVLVETQNNNGATSEIKWPEVWTDSQCSEFNTKYKWLIGSKDKHGETCEDPNLKCTFLGLKKKLESPEFLLDLGIMYDTLQELAILSKELQSRTTTLPRAEHLVKRTIRIIESFKENPGEKTQLALLASDKLLFKNVTLVRNSKIIPINKNKFLESLLDRMTARLCSDSNSDNVQLLKDLSALDPSNIKPNDVRYGESEVRRICRRFNVNEVQAIQGLRDFTENSESVPDNFKPLLNSVSTLPCSTAECERGFSLMNNIITDLRATLLLTNVSNLGR